MFKISLTNEVWSMPLVIDILGAKDSVDAKEQFEYYCDEANASGGLSAMRMEYDKEDMAISLHDDFDIGEMIDEINDYCNKIETEDYFNNRYFLELYNNGHLPAGDDTTFDYLGSFVSSILEILNELMEAGYGEEV